MHVFIVLPYLSIGFQGGGGGGGGGRFFLFYSVLCSGRHVVIKHAQDVTISLIKHAQKQIQRKSSVNENKLSKLSIVGRTIVDSHR